MFTNDQFTALQALESGENIFLTGGAGTGKTYLLKHFIEEQEAKKKNVIVCSPTGLAANNVEGVTIHRAFGLDVQPKINDPDIIPDFLKKVDIVIIDEISMVRCDLFEYVYKMLQGAEKRFKIKIQLIVSGDFYQLPPIIDNRDFEVLSLKYGKSMGPLYAFQSDLWNFKTVELTEIVRQDDKHFINALNRIRIGDDSGLTWIKNNCSQTPFNDATWIADRTKEVTRRNNSFLKKLSKKNQHTYIRKGGYKLRNSEIRYEYDLTLRENARVMILVNSSEKPPLFVNGTIAQVSSLHDDYVDVYIPDYGIYQEFYKDTQEVLGYKINDSGKFEAYVVDKYTQIPLRLCYAMTIHKSQGQTFDEINLTPGDWAPGLLYTALSRVKDVKKLYITSDITKYNPNVSDIVNNFYEDPDHYQYDWNNTYYADIHDQIANTGNMGFMYCISQSCYNIWLQDYNESVRLSKYSNIIGEEEFADEFSRRFK